MGAFFERPRKPISSKKYLTGFNVLSHFSLDPQLCKKGGEIKMLQLSELKRDWQVIKASQKKRPGPAGMMLPTHYVGALPLIQSGEEINERPGLFKRFASEVPETDSKFLRNARASNWAWCCEHLTPFAPDYIPTFEWWLGRSTYTGSEKTRLRNKRAKLRYTDGVLPRKLSARQMRVNIFKKKQWWDDYKHLRWIMPRSDAYKIQFGPVVAALEAAIYDVQEDGHPVFIKHVPVDDRPSLLEKTLNVPNSGWIATDHTCFEAHFVQKVQQTFEFTVYHYMCQRNPYMKAMVTRLQELQCGEQTILGPGFGMQFEARRMSGDVTTSLGNGLTNYLIMKHAFRRLGLSISGYVEGDDGIFRIWDPLGMLSTEQVLDRIPGPEYFRRYGMELKIECCNKVNTASFCGNIYHPKSCRNITNPISKILRLGWTYQNGYFDAKIGKLRGLQRAAALSLAVGYPGCPILNSYARMLLRSTCNVQPIFGDARHTVSWGELIDLGSVMGAEHWKMHTKHLVTLKPRTCDRELMAEVYNIPIPVQKNLEKFFDGLNGGPWTNDLFDRYVPDVFKVEWERQLCDRYPDFNLLPLTAPPRLKTPH